MKKNTVLLILLSFFIGFPTASASESNKIEKSSTKAMPYDFHLSIGQFSILNSDSSLSLKDTELNSGISVNLTDTLGLDFDHDITRLTLRYRFNPTHGLSFSWFDNESSATWQVDNELLNIVSSSNDALTSVLIDINYDISKLSYDWSFYHKDKIEVYTMLGINLMYIGLDYSVHGQQSMFGRATSQRAPLPAFGLTLNYRVNKHFYWHIKNEIFAINIDTISGTYSSFTFGGELALLKNIGLGVALYNENIDIRDKNQNSTFSYANNLYAMNIYLSAFF